MDNGIRIFSLPWKANWQIFEVIVHSGAVQDSVGKEGSAYTLGHLLSASVTKKNEVDFESFFRQCGGRVSIGNTSYNDTVYQFTVPLNHFSRAVEVFSQMLLGAEIGCENIVKKKFTVEQEYHFLNTPIAECVNKMIAQDLFYGTDYARVYSVMGCPSSLKKITHGDLLDYYYENYNPVNMTILTMGGASESDLLNIIEESLFGRKKDGKKNIPSGENINLLPPLVKKREISSSGISGQRPKNSKRCMLFMLSKLPLENLRVSTSLLSSYLQDVFYQEIKIVRDLVPIISMERGREVAELRINFPSLSVLAVDDIAKAVEEALFTATRDESLFELTKKRKISSLEMSDLSGKDVLRWADFNIIFFNRIITAKEERREYERVSFPDIIDLFRWLAPENRWSMIVKP